MISDSGVLTEGKKTENRSGVSEGGQKAQVGSIGQWKCQN